MVKLTEDVIARLSNEDLEELIKAMRLYRRINKTKLIVHGCAAPFVGGANVLCFVAPSIHLVSAKRRLRLLKAERTRRRQAPAILDGYGIANGILVVSTEASDELAQITIPAFDSDDFLDFISWVTIFLWKTAYLF